MINRFVGSWIILCGGATTHVTCQHEGKRQTAFAVPGGESGGASCAVAERDIRRPRRALVQHAWPASRAGGPGGGRASRAARRAAAGDPRASSASGQGCGVRRGTGEHGGARRSNRSLVPSGPVKSAVSVKRGPARPKAGSTSAETSPDTTAGRIFSRPAPFVTFSGLPGSIVDQGTGIYRNA